MCLGMPARITEVGPNGAEAEIDGVRRRIGTELVDGLEPGDWVLVHAGYAIAVIDRERALETLEQMKELL